MYFILFELKTDLKKKKEATWLEKRRGCRGMVSGFSGKDEAGFPGPVLGYPRGQGQY